MNNTELSQVVEALGKLTEEIKGLRSHMAQSKDIYTNAEVMAMLDVSAKTIRKWRDSGLLGYSKVGDTYLYTKEDIEKFLLDIHHAPVKTVIRLPKAL